MLLIVSMIFYIALERLLKMSMKQKTRKVSMTQIFGEKLRKSYSM